MYTRCLLPLLLAAILTACGPQRSRTAGRPITTNWFVTQFGEHHSKDGAWRVSVSATDHALELGRGRYVDRLATTNTDGMVLAVWTGALTNTYSTDGWRAQAGWFVFIEHDSRAWCYDGAEFLWLLQIEPNGSSGSYGPRCFPCAVPEQVLARLTEAARNAIGKESP